MRREKERGADVGSENLPELSLSIILKIASKLVLFLYSVSTTVEELACRALCENTIVLILFKLK